jgi:hypothetical protein
MRSGSWVLLCLAWTLPCQGPPSEVHQRSPANDEVSYTPRLPDPDTIVGAWEYRFRYVAPPMTRSRCAEVADAVSAARATAPEHALAWMINEEKVMRDAAAEKGWEGYDSLEELHTCRVVNQEQFYQLVHVDGGWRPGGVTATGFTRQVLVLGGVVVQRDDTTDPRVADLFFVRRRAAGIGDLLTSCSIFDEWKEHALVIRYCETRGSRENGRIVVGKSEFLRLPPTGIGAPYLGTRLVMAQKRAGTLTTYVVTLFDDHGRACKEWKSDWFAHRPRSFRMREYYSGSDAIRSDRDMTVLNHVTSTSLPSIEEVSVTPYERSTADDDRIDGCPQFDPRRGLPMVSVPEGAGHIPETMEPVSSTRKDAQTRPVRTGVPLPEKLPVSRTAKPSIWQNMWIVVASVAGIIAVVCGVYRYGKRA